jgi:FKBP-type peptidyl-prolyl cis-trans isomerase FklB
VTSTVTVNYRGMLIDGTEFDSTWAHGAPVSFPVNGVIPWLAGRDSAHARRRPLEGGDSTAAGLRRTGALPRIGPNEALVFEIELLDIKPQSDTP